MSDSAHNNFHLLRLALAALVMLSHGNYLFGLGGTWPIFHAAEWAVNGFFILSGLLISWSIDRGFHWRAYAIKRFARIYPLYAVVIALQCAVLLSFSHIPVTLGEMLRYVAANLATLNFIAPTLGDMVNFPFNGSLWTIKIEVMFYVALPIYVLLVRRFGLPFLLLSWAAAFLYRYALDAYSLVLARQLPGAMTFFIAGYVLHHYGAAFAMMASRRKLLSAFAFFGLAVIYLFAPFADLQSLAQLLLLMIILYMIAFYAKPIRLRYDVSYGVYLLHFPVFATLVHVNFMPAMPQMAFAVGCALVLVLSFVANILIEEPAIRWGKKKAKRYETNRAEL